VRAWQIAGLLMDQPTHHVDVLQNCVGFTAAWTGACWFAFGAGMLWMFRTGVLSP
jgi:hypothetical protein